MYSKIYQNLIDKKDILSVIGLGYVGLPIANEFAKKIKVIGFDVNNEKVELYKSGKDLTNEIGNKAIKESKIKFSSKPADLKKAKFHIVAVPTPINNDNTPDLSCVKSACEVLGNNLQKGSIVVFESTVYPGVTEDICAPILEKESGLKCGKDFKIGYSPERINPGDKIHRLNTITKIVSGMDKQSLNIIAKVYGLVVDAGVYQAESIKVAEAAKVIENSQRDINIAFMNELSIIFDKLNINTNKVLEAANTKWNFLDFKPGLVGGHCIGVDPYYLTYCAEKLGYKSQVILAGRNINDNMSKYIAQKTVKFLARSNKPIHKCKVAILGLTFKENCPDIRNTKVLDIYDELEEYGIDPIICDPWATAKDIKLVFGKKGCKINEIQNVDLVILAVKHMQFQKLTIKDFNKMLNKNKILFDIKNTLNKGEFTTNNYQYWSL